MCNRLTNPPMKKLKLFLLFTCALFLGNEAKAQDLVLNLLSGETSNYPVDDIRSIKFPANHMVIALHDGTLISTDISTISSYEFDMNPLSASEGEAANVKVLKIFPNPASERVQIAYTGRESTELTVEILDGNGRLIETLYRGGHAAETNALWHPGAVAKGSYLCRVTAKDRVVTGKIIVQ